MLKNDIKKVIDVCPNYYDIIGEKFPKNDLLSHEIVRYYKLIISTTHYNDNDELNKAMLLDRCVYAYFNDNKFNNLVINNIESMDKQFDLGIFLLGNYQNFKDDPANRVTTTKWI